MHCSLGANPVISDCIISNNHAGTYGGGVYCSSSNPIITHCVISFNNTVGCGGGRGGGIACDGANPQIINCTISGNAADTLGGGMYLVNNSHPIVVNSIVQGNTRGGGIYFGSSATDSIAYCDFWNNVGGNFIGSPPAWLGYLVNVNANGDSCDTHHNIYMNPLLVNPGAGNFNLQANSPCIDAGDPTSPHDPDNTIADIGAFYFNQIPMYMDVTTTPINPPIVIPANGGSFQYNINAHNLTTVPQTFSVWNKIKTASGSYIQVFGPATRTLPGGASPTRTLTQNVAATIPAGVNTYISYIGTYPGTIQDSSFFTFTKSATADGGPWITDNTCVGDLFDEYIVKTPAQFSLSGAYPNPFNPTTNISYQLSANSHVCLKVYEVSGKLVKTLVDGWRDAGLHDVVFDGSNLASGMYICRFWAGDQASIQKLLLLK
ncbi:MAG: right-handed parallel beta-helix repeat-containing protein [bacterium]|nr:right-handed parallel beta-helix repeat-containing protein [bacterium]